MTANGARVKETWLDDFIFGSINNTSTHLPFVTFSAKIPHVCSNIEEVDLYSEEPLHRRFRRGKMRLFSSVLPGLPDILGCRGCRSSHSRFVRTVSLVSTLTDNTLVPICWVILFSSPARPSHHHRYKPHTITSIAATLELLHPHPALCPFSF